jgi:hypothetical protein
MRNGVIEEKEYIDEILIKNEFYRDYLECGGGIPCYDNILQFGKIGIIFIFYHAICIYQNAYIFYQFL